MYSLSEQPASKIIEEMTNFKALKKIAIFTVNDKLNINDIVFEIGDKVAIKGFGENTLLIVPYEKCLRMKSKDLKKEFERVSFIYDVYSVDSFKKQFTLSEIETCKFEALQADIESINDKINKNDDSHFIIKDSSLALEILTMIIGIPFIIGFITLFLSEHIITGLIITILFSIVYFWLHGDIIRKQIKNNKTKQSFLKMFDDLDERRISNGTFLK